MILRIADLETEKERIVQVVRWYLASYHAGRKSSVAKKPYNPVLGEVFQCYWDVQEPQSGSTPEPLVTDGPVPWCRRDQLTFIAEQVSHHPPSKSFNLVYLVLNNCLKSENQKQNCLNFVCVLFYIGSRTALSIKFSLLVSRSLPSDY